MQITRGEIYPENVDPLAMKPGCAAPGFLFATITVRRTCTTQRVGR